MTETIRFSAQRLAVLIGMGTAVGLGVASPPATALPWNQLIFQGIQVLQLSNLSEQQKVQIGQDIHQQVLKNYQVVQNSRTNAQINQIGQRIVAASDCAQTPFRFYVVQDPSINAFSTIGGFVYVNTGLLKAAENEAQLASVMGHEIAHICNNDLVRRLKEGALAQGAATIAKLDRNMIANLGYRLAFELPRSRQDEFNADAKGLQYLVKAGYPASAMPAFLSKLLKSSSPPTFLSDHPAIRDRIATLQKKIASSGYQPR